MNLIVHLLFDPQIVREFHKDAVHRYRVHVESDTGAAPETIDYVLSAKCKDDSKSNPGGNVEIRFTKFRATMGDQTVRKDLMGNGLLQVATSGLPENIKIKLENESFWYPVLTWFLPTEIKNGSFDVSQVLGGGLTMVGNGTYKDGEFDLKAKMQDGAGKGPDATLSWQVGPDGWLVSGEGTVTSTGGTVTFKING